MMIKELLYKVYTDGGTKISNPSFQGTSAAVFTRKKDTSLNIEVFRSCYSSKKKTITSSRMEIIGLMIALEVILEKKIKYVEIFSDSSYVVKCFNKENKIHKNKDIWQKVFLLYEQCIKNKVYLKLNWISRKFNYLADAAVKIRNRVYIE